jgi:protein TonB
MSGSNIQEKVASGAVRGLRGAAALLAAAALTLFFFLLLPIIQEAGKPPEADAELRSVSTVNLPPPPPSPPEEPEKEEPEEDEPPPPEMEEAEAPPLDLAQIELALNPGFGGEGAAGDFTLNLDALGETASKQAEAIFALDDLDQPPKATVQTPPEYPRELARKKLKGTVKIVFVVDKSGRVASPVVQSASHPAFVPPALRAVRSWRFEPGRRRGTPVQFKMRVPIVFSSK